eukprot:scaffold1024_cov200-Pinguiococcus_pyrenoidosus.AAC.2
MPKGLRPGPSCCRAKSLSVKNDERGSPAMCLMSCWHVSVAAPMPSRLKPPSSIALSTRPSPVVSKCAKTSRMLKPASAASRRIAASSCCRTFTPDKDPSSAGAKGRGHAGPCSCEVGGHAIATAYKSRAPSSQARPCLSMA